MGKLQPSTVPAGIEKRECFWADFFTGVAADLVAAGVVEEHMLPGQPGRNKTSVTLGRRGDPDDIQIRRLSKKRFKVRKGIPAEERRRRREELEQEHAQKVAPREHVEKQVTDGDIEVALGILDLYQAYVDDLRARQKQQRQAERRPPYLRLVK